MRSPDAHQVPSEDHDAASELVDVLSGQEATDGTGDGRCILTVETQYRDPWMGSRGIAAHIREAPVQGDQESALAARGRHDVGVISTGQPFVLNCVDVMAERRSRLHR